MFVLQILAALVFFYPLCAAGFYLTVGAFEAIENTKKVRAVTRLLNLRADALENEKHD